jgi:hypothetical protein
MSDEHATPFERLGGSANEDAIARYVIAEAGRGRNLADVFDDPYVTNRADEGTLHRLLDRHDVVDAVGDATVAELRDRLRPT